MTPTPEQSSILQAATQGENNLQLVALAGTGKTTMLKLVAEALPKAEILYIAFNKSTVEHANRVLPSNCKAVTQNGLGHRAWGDTIGRRCVVDASKCYKLLRAEIEGLHGKEKDLAWKEMSETLDMIGMAKSLGYVPTGHFPDAKRLMDDEALFEALDPIPSQLQMDLVKRVMIRSIKQGFEGNLDFADQLLLPTVFSALFPVYPLILVDEEQDQSELNHVMLQKLVRKRIIGVGDRKQAIYAFRGAHTQSMELMQERFKMQELLLSVTFRCPQEVVKAAWWHAPQMKWPDWAIEGQVREAEGWTLGDVPDHAAIICRNNAPLFGMAIQFLKQGRNCRIVGNDIGKGLLRIMGKFGQPSMAQEDVLQAISDWTEKQLTKSRSPRSTLDRADCMRLFANNGHNLGEAVAYAKHLFEQSGPVTFLTGHKAKGLEFEDVFLLDKHLIRADEEEQEKNLLYVCQTRAKKSLTYVKSEAFQ